MTRLTITATNKKKPAPGAKLWVAARSPFDPKLAQDSVSAGDVSARLYIRGDAEGLRLPVEFLIVDGKDSEVCVLTSVVDSVGAFKTPLMSGHKRGVPLYPCQPHTTDANGGVTALFREPARVEVFSGAAKRLEGMDLSEGDNALNIEL